MKYLLIALCLTSASCARRHDPRTITGVDANSAADIALYVSYKGHPLYTEIPVQFADLPGNMVGLCTRWNSGERQIQIDRYHWEHFPSERYQIMAHELGHCDLNRDHISDLKDGWPISIMYPYSFSLTTNNIAEYMKELFAFNAPVFASPLFFNCVKDIEVK